MQIEHLLVDEIVIDSDSLSGIAKCTLYDFPHPEWVSAHREREGRQIGPMTLIADERRRNDLMNISIRSLGERRLHTEGPPARLVISYKDRWTPPPWSVYALIFPRGFVATRIALDPCDSLGWAPPLQIGVSHDERLFYHTVVEGNGHPRVFDIEARLGRNENRYRELVNDAETVSGTNHFEHLRNAIGREAATADFWFKLLELGSKLLGLP
jgi:hypothetical protein